MPQIQYTVTEQDLVAFNEHQLEKSERIQKKMRLHQAIIPGIIAVFALVLFFYFKDIPSAGYAIILMIVWGLGAPAYLKWNMRKQIRQSYTEKEKAAITGTFTLRAESHGLVEIGADGQSNHLSWDKVLRVEVEKLYVFVFISLESALIIPRKSLTKESKLADFVIAAEKYIDKAS